jgi:hypothetical protein
MAELCLATRQARRRGVEHAAQSFLKVGDLQALQGRGRGHAVEQVPGCWGEAAQLGQEPLGRSMDARELLGDTFDHQPFADRGNDRSVDHQG